MERMPSGMRRHGRHTRIACLYTAQAYRYKNNTFRLGYCTNHTVKQEDLRRAQCNAPLQHGASLTCGHMRGRLQYGTFIASTHANLQALFCSAANYIGHDLYCKYNQTEERATAYSFTLAGFTMTARSTGASQQANVLRV